MGVLKNNQKKDIRFEMGDVVLYEPTVAQREELKSVIAKNTDIDLEKGEAVSTYSYEIVRYILKYFTSIGDEIDELNDSELEEQIENGNHKISRLMMEIENMLREITEETINACMRDVKNLNEQLKMIDMTSELNDIRKTFNDLAKKNGINKTFDDMLEVGIKELEAKKDDTK